MTVQDVRLLNISCFCLYFCNKDLQTLSQGVEWLKSAFLQIVDQFFCIHRLKKPYCRTNGQKAAWSTDGDSQRATTQTVQGISLCVTGSLLGKSSGMVNCRAFMLLFLIFRFCLSSSCLIFPLLDLIFKNTVFHLLHLTGHVALRLVLEEEHIFVCGQLSEKFQVICSSQNLSTQRNRVQSHQTALQSTVILLSCSLKAKIQRENYFHYSQSIWFKSLF